MRKRVRKTKRRSRRKSNLRRGYRRSVRRQSKRSKRSLRKSRINVGRNVPCGVKEPWGSMILSGEKTAEGRLDVDKWSEIQAGDTLTIKLDNGSHIERTVSRVDRYPDIRSALEKDLSKLLPGIQSVEDGLAIYSDFYDIRRPFVSIHMRI